MGAILVRLVALEQLVARLLTRVDALERRIAALEQQLNDRWNSQ
jgi:hypothetical protein